MASSLVEYPGMNSTDSDSTTNLMIWFEDMGEKEYMYRPWNHLHERGVIEKYDSIHHNALTHSPIRYSQRFLETRNWRWVVSIPPFSRSLFPLYMASVMGKETVFFTSYPNWNEPIFNTDSGISNLLWRRYLRSNKVVSVTPAAKKSLQENLGVNSTVIPHSCDTETFHPKNEVTNNSSPVVLFVGRLVREKGIGSLLKVASEYPEFDFWFCGDGPKKKEVQRAAKAHEQVSYLGYINNDDELSEIYNQASVLVLPSIRSEGWSEYFGLVLIEAMACGTPVIATNHPGPRSIVTEDTGLLIPERDTETLSKKIFELLSDEVRLREMGKAARNRVTHTYDVSTVATKWEEVLRGEGTKNGY